MKLHKKKNIQSVQHTYKLWFSGPLRKSKKNESLRDIVNYAKIKNILGFEYYVDILSLKLGKIQYDVGSSVWMQNGGYEQERQGREIRKKKRVN